MWFICLRKAVQPRDQWTTSVDEHLAWMKRQHEAGAIVMSGPGTLGSERYGIYLIHAGSRTEAESVAAGDPFTANGHCSYELVDWEVHQIIGAGPFVGGQLPQPGPDRS